MISSINQQLESNKPHIDLRSVLGMSKSRRKIKLPDQAGKLSKNSGEIGRFVGRI